MNFDTKFIQSEIGRVGARVKELEGQSKVHAETRAHLAQKISQLEDKLASGVADPQFYQKVLSHLRIEDEQIAEAERLVKHHLMERNIQLDEFSTVLEMQQDSSIT